MIETISQWGLLVVWAIAVRLAYKYFNKKIWVKSVKSPLSHRFFSVMDEYRSTTIKNIKSMYKWCFCLWRTEMLRFMLETKFKIWKEWMEKATREVLKMTDEEDILKRNSDALSKIINDYEKEWRENNVPEVVIKKFYEWHTPHMKPFFKTIRQICSWVSFNSVEEVQNAILFLSYWLMIQTIIDAEQSLGSLNWELSWLKFNFKWKTLILE